MSGIPQSSWDPGSIWGRQGARCWRCPSPRGCPEPHPGLCRAPLYTKQAATLPCVTARRRGWGHGCAGSERPGDRVQPGHRTGACAAARCQPPASPAHLCHLPRPQGPKRKGQWGHREWDGAEPGGQWGSAVPAALLGCCPGWVSQEWGQKCSGGPINSPAPWIRQPPVWPGGMRLERHMCLQHSLLAVPVASQPLFCPGITQDGGQFLSPVAPFSC